MTFTAVLGLLEQLPAAAPPVGATTAQLDAIGFPLPPQLRDWLARCNGYTVGPWRLAGSADLTAGAEITVAEDGQGKRYVLDGDGFARFVDGATAYVVASSLERLLVFLIERELGQFAWPFSSVHVLARDPGLAGAPDQLLPWRGPWAIQRQVSAAELTARTALVAATIAALRRAGLPAALDAPDANRAPGARVTLDPGDDAAGGVYVAWEASEELSTEVVDAARNSRFTDPAIAESGDISATMQHALAAILRATGFDVQTDTSETNDLLDYAVQVNAAPG